MGSFFHLTQLGYQRPIGSAVLPPPPTPPNPAAPLPPPPPPTQPREALRLPEIGGRSVGDSHAKLRALMTKHARGVQDAHEIYRIPVVTSFDYGWWRREAPSSLAWTRQPRACKVHSEMTRFVEQMAMTNREFSLF